MLKGPLSVWNSALNPTLTQPALGPASRIQAVAPRNGGVTKVASTSVRTSPFHGMSVRETAQAIGTPSTTASADTPNPITRELRNPKR